MGKLEKLVSLCRGEVVVTFNQHRSCYLSVEDEFASLEGDAPSPEILAEMVRLDRIVCVHFYPNTPVGFHMVYHHDLDAALDRALELVS